MEPVGTVRSQCVYTDALPGGPCDLCDGSGELSLGCDAPDACFQCHGTGIQRARGNCDACSGWGWTYGAHRCVPCRESGWTDDDVALFWCATCRRTVASAPRTPRCPVDEEHAVARVTAAFRKG